MRLFSEQENTLLKKIVEYKQAGNMIDLQVARLLRKNLSAIAITWEIDPIPTVKVYSLSKDFKETVQLYFSVVDFIYFIKELEKIGFVQLIDIPSNTNEKRMELYDREKYDFIRHKNQFVDKNLNKEDGILSLMSDFEYNLFGKRDGTEYVSPLALQSLPIGLAYDLDNIVYRIIYPMPVLEDYVRSRFKTLEDKRFEHNIELTYRAIKISNRTFLISTLAFLSSVIAICTSIYFGNKQLETPITINESQLHHIEDIIEENNKFDIPIIRSATLKVEYQNKQDE